MFKSFFAKILFERFASEVKIYFCILSVVNVAMLAADSAAAAGLRRSGGALLNVLIYLLF